MDFTEMTDEEVLALRNEVNTEADRRLAALTLRNDALDLAKKAKGLGRTPEELQVLAQDAITAAYSEPDEAPVE